MFEGATLLFVDDEVEILHSLKRQLRKEEYRILTAVGGAQALEILEHEAVHVLVSDERMPGMSGVQLLSKVRELYPNMVRILLSGYTDSQTILNSINMGEVYRFITKPWEKENLQEVIAEAFSQYKVNLITRENMEDILQENRLLKQELQERNCPLCLTREILEKSSHTVVAVTKDGDIENFETADGFCSLDDTEMESVMSKILEGLELPGGRKSFDVMVRGGAVRLYTRALRSCDPYKGLVFILCPDCSGDN